MAQFTIYRSSDTNAPSFYGTTGSVIALLDACLVNGYGTKPGAGWSKPFTNTGSGVFGQSYGAWTMPSGSTSMSLFINDNGPGAGTYKEAFAAGWELLVSPSASVSNTMGSGSGQFPTPAQLLTTGHVVIRKSVTADSSSLRQWIIAADSSSMYMFIDTGDTANMYYGFGFGDIYSFTGAGTGSADPYRCIIMGRNAENTAAAGNEGIDFMSAINSATNGHFFPRSFTGLGTSVLASKHGDTTKGGLSFVGGTIPFPNPCDTALYVSPVWACESVSQTVRGQLRGFYQVCHATTNFTDGQTFTGALDFNGKTFFIIKSVPNAGLYAIETSNTLLTN